MKSIQSVNIQQAGWKEMTDLHVFKFFYLFNFIHVNSVILLWHFTNVEIYHFLMTYRDQ